MAKVFISIPMNGRSREDILAEQQKALYKATEILGEPCQMIESCQKDYAEMKPLECLGHSLILLSTADVAVFAPGWAKARGCRIENICASEYGLKVLELPEN